MVDISMGTDSFGCAKSSLARDFSYTAAGLNFHVKDGGRTDAHQVRGSATSSNHLLGISLGNSHQRTIYTGKSSEKYCFNAGDIYLRTLDNDYSADVTGSFQFLLVEFDDEAIYEHANEVGMAGIKELRRVTAKPDPVLGGLAAALSTSHIVPLLAERGALAVAAHLVSHYVIAARGPKLINGALSYAKQRLAKDFILSNLNNNITVSDVASECGLSLSAFTRAFKQSIGSSPHQWMMDARLELACKLMADPALSISNIASICGFYDDSHFGRVFLSRFGVRPGLWRRNHLEVSGTLVK